MIVWGMLSVTALITGYEIVGDHTEFVVQVSCNGVVWLISRRFSDFDQLHSRLLRNFDGVIDAKLPEKQWFGRFDPNFLAKRQLRLQQYIEVLLRVPGITEDRSLIHFLELERNLDLSADLPGGHSNSIGGRSGGPQSKSVLLSENDRLSAIVDSVAHAFIDISELPEPLEAEQAMQRKNEIVNASQNVVTDQLVQEEFAKLTVLQLPDSCTSMDTKKMAQIVSFLENRNGINYTHDMQRLHATLQQVQVGIDFKPVNPSQELVAIFVDPNAQETGGAASGSYPNSTGSNGATTTNGNSFGPQ